MPEPGTPEEPKPNNEASQGKGAFGWYRPNENPRKLNEGDDTPLKDQAPVKDQREFHMYAIRLAQLEDELLEKLKLRTKDMGMNLRKIHDKVYIDGFMGNRISSYMEDIKGIDDKQAHVEFDDTLGPPNNPVGVKNNRTLSIDLYTDRDSYDSYKKWYTKWSLKNPDKMRHAATIYYFDNEGNYGKIVAVDPDYKIDPGTPIMKAGQYNAFQSEMTPGDFELAGQALHMLIDRLKSQPQPE